MVTTTARHPITLFWLSFLTLFLELIMVRYLAANIRNLGYFPNLVLLSAFIGMGLGFILHPRISEATSQKVFGGALALLVGLMTLIQAGTALVPGFNGYGNGTFEEVFFTAPGVDSLSGVLVFALAMLMLLTAFAAVSQRTAKWFARFEPLRAYTWDIGGSCAGVASFILLSAVHAPANLWFAALIPLVWLALPDDTLGIRKLLVVPLGVLVALVSYQDARRYLEQPDGMVDVRWSPYQKVEYVEAMDQGILVNGIGHQSMRPEGGLNGKFYHFPYIDRVRRGMPLFNNVLVMGAGSGNDVAMALLSGAEHVDAVEIDPVIASMGALYHPLKPYADPRVNLVVDDARSFMARTPRKYDLIIFALTDSLVRASAMSQLRLENYLFTQESVDRAFELLNPQGSMVFYNSYRRPWVIWKLQMMVHNTTGKYPRLLLRDDESVFWVLSALKGDTEDGPAPPPESATLDVATDDWPFPYLQSRRLPRVYLGLMSVFTVLLLLGMAWLQRDWNRRAPLEMKDKGHLRWSFALMGAAFLLLETKSIIRFSLLFGTTWLNTSLVMLFMLLLVLAANVAARRMAATRTTLWAVFALLILSCLLGVWVPLSSLLALPGFGVRLLCAALLTFTPVFLANVLFGLTFKDAQVAEVLFGFNVLGAALGGVAEYFSLALGYNALGLLVACIYAVAFGLLLRGHTNAPVRTDITV